MSYRVKIEDIQSWKTTHYPDVQNTVSYVFSRGKNRFQLTNSQVEPDRLEVLDSDASVTFSWSRENSAFGASVRVGKTSPGEKDLDSSNYDTLMNMAFVSPLGDYYCSNYFMIKKLN